MHFDSAVIRRFKDLPLAFRSFFLLHICFVLVRALKLADFPDKLAHFRAFQTRAEAKDIRWAITVWSRRIPYLNNCLVRSYCFFLMSSAKDIRLKIATRLRPDFQAHAWVEDGQENRLIEANFDAENFSSLCVIDKQGIYPDLALNSRP